jgi:small subunit ribosomal protein SAe
MFSLMQVDLFFYREPEEAKEQEEDEVAVPDYAIADFNAASIPNDGQWPAAIDQPWADSVPQPIAAAPSNWTAPEAGKCLVHLLVNSLLEHV